MKHKQRFPGIMGFALMLVVFGALLSQPSAPEAEPPLVTYLVTWHGTARGSGHNAGTVSGGGGWEVGLKHFAEMRGSAIVRFEQATNGSGRILIPYDTRYLSLIYNDSWRQSFASQFRAAQYAERMVDFPAFIFSDTTDPNENSGLYVRARSGNEKELQLLGDGVQRTNGMVFQAAFGALGHLRFNHRIRAIGRPECNLFRQREEARTDYLPVSAGWGGGALLHPPDGLKMYEKWALTLQAASPKDDSFSLHVRFSNIINGLDTSLAIGDVDGTDEVEWTAEAHRLGTCPCALNSN